MAKGAFQTSRDIFENPIWNDVVKFRIFFYIYGNAVFAKEGATIATVHLKRGQFLRSYRNLQNDLAYIEKRAIKTYSLGTIKTKIDALVKENRIEIETTDYGTLFTVLNYESYQGFERYTSTLSEQQMNSKRTATEQYLNNNKNVNNVKNDNLKDTMLGSPLTTESTKKINDSRREMYTTIVDYLNLKADTKFRSDSKVTQTHINARLGERFSIDDFKKVIDVKCAEWLNDPDRQQYLRPKTLFGPNFESYLNQKPVAKRQKQETNSPIHFGVRSPKREKLPEWALDNQEMSQADTVPMSKERQQHLADMLNEIERNEDGS